MQGGVGSSLDGSRLRQIFKGTLPVQVNVRLGAEQSKTKPRLVSNTHLLSQVSLVLKSLEV